MKRKLMLTGASGFIGQAVLNALSKGDVEVIAVYRSHPGTAGGNIHWQQADLLDTEQVKQLFAAHKPDSLIQLAWCTGQGSYWKDPMNLDWITANLHIAKEFLRNGGQRCLFGGTSAEYDWSGNLPLAEASTPLNPLMLYGGAKLATYWALTRYFEQEHCSFGWLRFFNPFGPGEDRARLIPKTCLRLLKGETLEYDAALSQRDFLHIDEVGDAVAHVLDTQLTGPINIASGEAVSVRSVISMIAANYKRGEQVSFRAPEEKDQQADAVVADISKLLGSGWKPAKTFQQSIEETCRWWEHNKI